jgi:hypothetical protein
MADKWGCVALPRRCALRDGRSTGSLARAELAGQQEAAFQGVWWGIALIDGEAAGLKLCRCGMN